MDVPLALVAVHGEEKSAARRRVVDGGVQNQEVGAELADRKSLPVEQQVHFHIGGMAGLTRGSKDGRRDH